jgi:hypothetical protein
MKKIFFIFVFFISVRGFSQNDIFKFNDWGTHQTEQLKSSKVWKKNNNPSEKGLLFKRIKKRRKRAQRRLRFFRRSNV